MNQGSLFVIGATHRTAPFGVREKLALVDEAESSLSRDLAGIEGLHEFVILNTCNRVEIYGAAEGPEIASRIEDALCARRGFDPREYARFRLELRGREAVQHLLEVATGLDSQMLGETEIFGQAKRAYATAQARGSAGPVLNRLFQKAFQAAKHARTNTAVTCGQVSVANVAVDLALTIFGGLEEARILLLGAGDIGARTARAFASRGARRLTVCSRNFERARELADVLGARVLAFESHAECLSDYDVVVASTSAPHHVVSTPMVRSAVGARPRRPLFLIDLAMPRNVDPAAKEVDGAFLYDLEDLARIARENRLAREAETDRCRSLLTARAESLWSQVEARLAAGWEPDEASAVPEGSLRLTHAAGAL